MWDEDEKVSFSDGVTGAKKGMAGLGNFFKDLRGGDTDSFLGWAALPLGSLPGGCTAELEPLGRSKRSRVSGTVTVAVAVEAASKYGPPLPQPSMHSYTAMLTQLIAKSDGELAGAEWTGQLPEKLFGVMCRFRLHLGLSELQLAVSEWAAMVEFYSRRKARINPDAVSDALADVTARLQ